METKFIKRIAPGLNLYQYNEIPVIKLEHNVGQAEIALQGAHLFYWKPQHTTKSVLWISKIEPFKLGLAIRGGIPLCYPWFGNADGLPSHGYARISLWQLSDYYISEQKVRLEFSLFSKENLIIAKTSMTFTNECEIKFTNYAEENAQIALHSYFNIANIEQVELHGLPTNVFNSLNKQQETVPSPRIINQLTDCIYSAKFTTTIIQDKALQRQINVEHINASNIVVWNPWHKATSGMNKESYKTMVCVETARIDKRLALGEEVSVKISVINKENN